MILLNFQWENYSSFNNFWIVGLNIKRPHWWIYIHQGLSNGTKCMMKGSGWGVVTWEVSTWQQNKQTTFMDDRLVHSFTLVLKFLDTTRNRSLCSKKRIIEVLSNQVSENFFFFFSSIGAICSEVFKLLIGPPLILHDTCITSSS